MVVVVPVKFASVIVVESAVNGSSNCVCSGRCLNSGSISCCGGSISGGGSANSSSDGGGSSAVGSINSGSSSYYCSSGTNCAEL